MTHQAPAQANQNAGGIKLGIDFSRFPAHLFQSRFAQSFTPITVLPLLSLAYPMRILVAISVLVLVVLLWATVSIVQHIRKSRRRSRFLREKPQQIDATPAPLAPEPTSVRAVVEPSSPAGVSSARRATASQSPSASALGLIAAARKLSHDMPQPQIRPSGIRQAATTTPEPQPVLRIVEVPPVEIPVILPQPVLAEVVTQPLALVAAESPVFPAISAIPFLSRPVRSAQPAPAFTLPAHRPDWIYFNKDMGDLSDPTPSRIRDRVRSR